MSRPRARPCVLLVEDFVDAREMYCDYLSFCGFDVLEASDGAEALELASDTLPDMIVMDLALPRVDGWAATQRLKQDPRTRRIPVLALTGYALGGYEDTAREAGCDAFLAKPCLPDQLVAEIRRLLAAVAAEPPPEDAGRSRRDAARPAGRRRRSRHGRMRR